MAPPLESTPPTTPLLLPSPLTAFPPHLPPLPPSSFQTAPLSQPSLPCSLPSPPFHPSPSHTLSPPPLTRPWDSHSLGSEDEELPLHSHLSHPPHSPADEGLLAVRLAVWGSCAYLCVYCLRKPWSAASFASSPPHTKLTLTLAQCIGYFGGKLVGVGVVSAVEGRCVPRALSLAAIGSGLGWALFALPAGCSLLSLPPPSALPSLFAIGWASAPLALMWSLLYRLVEGR